MELFLETIGYILLAIIFTMIYLVGFSYTELGPFTQLPTGRRLDRKTGKSNIVGHFLNESGYGIDQEGNIYEDEEDKYLKNLRRNFFFRYFGMVYTGLPYIPLPGLGGVIGSWVKEFMLKISKDKETGVVTAKVEEVGEEVYYTAPPIFFKQAKVLSGIPIEGNNLLEFAFSFTLRITNVRQYQYRINDPTGLVSENFESMIRPKVVKMSLEEAQQLSSEQDGTNATPINEIVEATDKMLKTKGYGCKIHELNLPIVQPTGAYANAVRQKATNEALREADKPLVDKDVYRTEKTGRADATARQQLSDATTPWVALEKGMGGVQPGATVVLGQAVMPSLPLTSGKRGREEKPEEETKNPKKR